MPSTKLSTPEAARIAIDEVWPAGSECDRGEVIGAVARLLADHIAAERSRCADICRNRAALWRRTPLAGSELPSAREEARARANEATYLADFIESAQPQPVEAGETPN